MIYNKWALAFFRSFCQLFLSIAKFLQFFTSKVLISFGSHHLLISAQSFQFSLFLLACCKIVS
jgi:hypothetical protein